MAIMSRACSIIIVTYNSIDHIDACLAGLSQLHMNEPPEILVVDNASSDDTIPLIQARHPTVKLLPQQVNWGFAGGVNRGVQVASGTNIALLNPDAVPNPDWLAHLVTPLHDVDIGVTGSKVLGVDGRIQSVGAVVELPALLPRYRGENEDDQGQYDQPVDVWSVHGAAMAFRREVWQTLGGFDEGFFPAYLEESDFCERARQARLQVITAPQAIVRHRESTTTGKYSAQFYFYFLRNRLRYAAKWQPWPVLWHEFRLAEHLRLRATSLLDRRVARLVYQMAVPTLEVPSEAERAAVLAIGRNLQANGQPDDGIGPLLTQVSKAQDEAVHHETLFQSRLPFAAALRTVWNNIATRWYVRPNLDQQTRYNLALERAASQMIDQVSAQAAASALDTALLSWRLEQLMNERVV